MLKEYSDIFRRLMIAADLFLIGIVFIFSYWFRVQHSVGLPVLDYCVWLGLIIMSLWVASLYYLGMYRSFRLKSIVNILWIILRAGLMAFLFYGAITYMFRIVHISRIFITMVFGLTTVVLSVEKIIMFLFFKEIRRRGFNFRNVLIIGMNKRAQRFMRIIDNNRDFGLKIIGVLDEDPGRIGQKAGHYEVIGTFYDLPAILEQMVVDQVIVIVPRSTLEKIEPLVHHCETTGTTVSVAVDLFNPQLTVGKGESVLGFPMITFQTVTDKVGQLIIKRIFDIVLSASLILLVSPLYLIIALLIKLTSKGPVYFVQERCGLQGRRFKLYKFRTMVQDAESRLESLKDKNEMKGHAFKIRLDPRITPIGRFLRKWSLDELPQLWNILHGSMSLVGPRPPMPREVEEYDHWQRRRLSMRPGLTGLWQVSGRNNISDFDDWVKLDLQYMDNWSLKEDAKIIMRTVPAVLRGTGAR